jgi:hypothetical protein
MDHRLGVENLISGRRARSRGAQGQRSCWRGFHADLPSLAPVRGDQLCRLDAGVTTKGRSRGDRRPHIVDLDIRLDAPM